MRCVRTKHIGSRNINYGITRTRTDIQRRFIEFNSFCSNTHISKMQKKSFYY